MSYFDTAKIHILQETRKKVEYIFYFFKDKKALYPSYSAQNDIIRHFLVQKFAHSK